MENYPTLAHFVRRVANYLKDGECETHDRTCEGDKDDCVLFDMPSDDAVETLHTIIDDARFLRDHPDPDVPTGDRWLQVHASSAFRAEKPWCGWTVAFASGSDWDTTGFGLEKLVNVNLLLTTADGRSRPVNITDWSRIEPRNDEQGRAEGIGGILAHELDTTDWEKRTDMVAEFVRYEDIREIVVY